MCQLAIDSLPADIRSRVEVNPIEILREGPSYAIDTVDAVAATYPDAQMVSTYGGYPSITGTGSIFQVVLSNTGQFGLPYRFYLGETRPQGRYPVSGTGYNVGDKIVIPGSVVLTGIGSTTANDIVITVVKVNNTGGILSAKISGTTPNASQGFRIDDINRNSYVRPDVFIDNFNVTFLNGVPGTAKPIINPASLGPGAA
jgi:hypothetical protein